jgi:hypothetical protein
LVEELQDLRTDGVEPLAAAASTSVAPRHLLTLVRPPLR